jgi:hypothetical protein
MDPEKNQVLRFIFDEVVARKLQIWGVCGHRNEVCRYRRPNKICRIIPHMEDYTGLWV